MNRITPYQSIVNCKIGKHTKIWKFVNLYGCTVGTGCMIGTFVEIQEGVRIGNNVRIQSHSFLCEGVELEDNVFIGHNVIFINDRYPRVMTTQGMKKIYKKTDLLKTRVKNGASIGSQATILGGLTIGKRALIGAGSVITKDVPDYAVVAGNPARVLRIAKNI